MYQLNSKVIHAAVLSAILLAGCGGGGGGDAAAAPDIGQSVTALLDFMTNLIAGSENGDLVDVNALTLAVDDAGDAIAF